MTPFLDRRAADDLARRLDGAGEPPPIAVALRDAGRSLDDAVVPRAEFRAALRTRLLAVATVQAAQAGTAPAEPVNARHAALSRRRAQRASRAPAVAAGALASVVALTGVAVAGSQSLPGEPFYGVKTAAESLQLRLAGDDVERGNAHLELAATRLREVRALTLGRDAASVALPASTTGSAPEPTVGPPLPADVARLVRDTLAEMDASTRTGSALLTGAWQSTRTSAPLVSLERFAARQGAALAGLLPALPAGIQDQGRASLALVSEIGAQAEQLLGTGACAAGCDPSAAAPQLPAAPGSTGGTGDCRCPSPLPAPSPQPRPTTSPAPGGAPSTPPSSAPVAPPPSEQPTAPGTPPSPPPSSQPLPVPVPVPVPVPSLPVPSLPLPSVSLPPLLEQPLDETVDDLQDVLDGVLDPLLPSSLRTAP